MTFNNAGATDLVYRAERGPLPAATLARLEVLYESDFRLSPTSGRAGP